ncbi:MAG: aminopeptidase N [Rhodospirillales bacterium]|nr:aminopeptidase N [Rhodospirillales bacterium]
MPDSDHAVPHTTRRGDYRPPAYLVDRVDLRFDLDPQATRVRSRLALRRNPASPGNEPLRLDGEALILRALRLDGAALSTNRYRIEADGALAIADMPDAGELEIEVEISPAANSELSGLYLSGGNYFTQCEAEGFRRITYFPDRPDVMARFTTTISAPRATVPVLLSNGNLTAQGQDGTRHWATWTDPHPKPAYLFAVVAGDLVAVRDRFTTQSGRDVDLAIWVRAADADRCAHAMRSLKASMRWDEEVYGREYDLDIFNIAAVSDFNMGAMENKGLNVFNTKYVLARPDTATDGDYQGIESVIAHEYFHNWTGNRITCRDWFQLSLKEGLTVFRDQQFSADQGSAAVKRLGDVRVLRAGQFPEDAGPLAHPVRPDSYMAIDNFYTATVYQKGAEIVRMMHTLMGAQGFRKGMDLYFARHDNQAVTIEDFVAALQDGSGVDLRGFLAWYAQSGTPELRVEDHYDAQGRRYTLTLRQSTPPTPEQPTKRPLPIPVAMALLDGAGREMAATLDGATQAGTRLLLLKEAEQSFVFADVAEAPVPSLLRGFSAPVTLAGISTDTRLFLAAHDTDPFVRWESGQQYATAVILDQVAGWRRGQAPRLDAGLAEALRATLTASPGDPAFAAEAILLPGESFIADQMAVADVEAIHAVRSALRRQIGTELGPLLRAVYDRLTDHGPYGIDGAAIGRRALRNACLSYLAAAGDEGIALAKAQFDADRNMTDTLAALMALAASDAAARESVLAAFHARWHGDDLVLDKWFAIQATSPRAQTLDEVRRLSRHPDFDLRNPNRVRALVGSFSAGNPVRFHDASGAGYAFLADTVMALDPINGQVAARIINPLGTWRRYDSDRASKMRHQLERILALPKLSRGTYEKASKGLAS